MTRTLRKDKGMAGAAFLLTLGMAVALFLPFVIYDKGYFIYYGDFNAQQIPFYQLAHAAVRSGNIGWSWTTDLGANFIGSYSFYLLGSPFFWLTLPFPNAWVPFMMAPLLALKMGCAGLTAYAFSRRFLRPRMAVIAGVLYAFSGFSLYNVFFNHFHEALIWFPLLLLGIEQYMCEGRRGLFAVAVFFTALSNYYFFIGQTLFVMIYWIVRAPSPEWSHRCRRFFGLWLQAVIGVAAAAVLLLPSYYAVIQNGRTEQHLEGFGFLIYGSGQRLYDILHCYVFPPEPPARANFLPDANNKWASMSLWIPLFGATGAIAYFQSRKHTDWLRRLLIVLFFCTVIPGLNAMFQLFNQIYYARWFYMFTLMLILATLRCFDEAEPINWGRAIGWSGGITAAFTVLIGLIPKKWTPDEKTGKLTIGLEKYPEWFWLYVAIAFACLMLTGVLVMLWKNNRQRFVSCCTAACVAVSLCFGWGYLTIGKTISNYPDTYVIEKLIKGGDFDLPEGGFCRTDMNKGMDNQGMYWGYPCIQAFHSIVPGSVMDFYNSVGVSRSVGSRPDSTHYALRGLLSVRWLFDYAPTPDDVQLYNKKDADYFEQDGTTAMPGWKLYGTQDGYRIYENENFIPMGFCYDGYITRSEWDALPEADREPALLKALVVEDEDAATVPIAHLSTATMYFSEYDYAQDCAARAATAATSFVRDDGGFTAVFNCPEDTAVFFSVPYEEGWSAAVNGQPADIRLVNVGFMAVDCPAGESVTVRFDYQTPGLRLGAIISAGGLLALLIYLLCCIAPNRRARTEAAAFLPMSEGFADAPEDDLPAIPAPIESITPLSAPVGPPAEASAPVAPHTAESPEPDNSGFDLYSIYQPERSAPEQPAADNPDKE